MDCIVYEVAKSQTRESDFHFHMYIYIYIYIFVLCLCLLVATMSDSVTPWTAAHQAPLTTEFPKQEYCSGLPFPSPGAHPNLGIKPGSLALQADSFLSEPPGKSLSLLLSAKLLSLLVTS